MRDSVAAAAGGGDMDGGNVPTAFPAPRYERYVTRNELAEIMGVSVRAIDDMRREGLPFETWGMRAVRFLPSRAIAWASRRGKAVSPGISPVSTPLPDAEGLEPEEAEDGGTVFWLDDRGVRHPGLRCAALNAKGEQCGSSALAGGDLCECHDNRRRAA